MMKRTLSLAMATWLVSVSPGLQALGLAEPQVESSLSEPLRARIELRDLQGRDPRQLRVSLADEAAFRQAGLSRSALVERVNLALSDDNGQIAVTLSTEQPVNEPYLDLLLSLTWPGGELQRQVTLLLDPPGYASIPALVGDRQPTSRAPSEREAREATPEAPGGSPLSRQLRVQPGDTLWDLAGRVGQNRGVSLEQAMLALWQANPEAFSGGNINNLRAGVTLDVPSRERLLAHDTTEARRQIDAQHQAWREAQDAPAETASAPAEAAPTSEPEPRLTLLSDAELAGEQGERPPAAASSGDERSASGRESAAQADERRGTASDGTPASPGEAGESARLDALEANWQASQAALAQVREERDHLASEIAALRQEMTELRGMIDAPPESAANTSTQASTQATVQAPAGSSAPEAERGLWQWLMDNLVMIGGAMVALLLALLVVLRRRDQARDESYAGEMLSLHQVAGAQQGNGASSSASPQDTPAPVGPPAVEQAPQAEAINEADIFIAYGRYGQARELLEQSLVGEPGRDDLRLKLLAVYLELGERQAAEREARYLAEWGDPESQREAQRLMARVAQEANVADDYEAELSTIEAPETDRHGVENYPRHGPGEAFGDSGTPEPARPAASQPEKAGEATREPAAKKVDRSADNAERIIGYEPPSLDKPEESGEAARAPAAKAVDRPVDNAEHVIDYEPPSLDPSPSQRQDDLRQPSIDYPGSLGGASPPAKEDIPASAGIGEPDWDVEEVAFEPLNLDNERPVAGASRTTSEH